MILLFIKSFILLFNCKNNKTLYKYIIIILILISLVFNLLNFNKFIYISNINNHYFLITYKLINYYNNNFINVIILIITIIIIFFKNDQEIKLINLISWSFLKKIIIIVIISIITLNDYSIFINFSKNKLIFNNNININQALLNNIILIHPITTHILYSYILYFIYFYFCKIFNKKIFSIFFIKYFTKIKIYKIQLTALILILGSFWASQELLWNNWWSWDLIELVSLIIFLNILQYFHIYKKKNFFFCKYNFQINNYYIFFIFYFFIRYDITTSLHSFNNLSFSENFFFWILSIFISLNFFFFAKKFKLINIDRIQKKKFSEKDKLLNLIFFFQKILILSIYIYCYNCLFNLNLNLNLKNDLIYFYSNLYKLYIYIYIIFYFLKFNKNTNVNIIIWIILFKLYVFRLIEFKILNSISLKTYNLNKIIHIMIFTVVFLLNYFNLKLNFFFFKNDFLKIYENNIIYFFKKINYVKINKLEFFDLNNQMILTYNYTLNNYLMYNYKLKSFDYLNQKWTNINFNYLINNDSINIKHFNVVTTLNYLVVYLNNFNLPIIILFLIIFFFKKKKKIKIYNNNFLLKF